MPNRKHIPVIAGLLCSALLSGSAWAAGVAYVSNEKGGVSVIDLDSLKITKEIDLAGKIPRGLAVTDDGAYVLTANKDTDDVSVIDTKAGKVVRSIAVGDGPEFLRIRGNYAFVTFEPGGRRDDAGKAEDPSKNDQRAEIGVIDLKEWKLVRAIKSGLETEGLEFSRDGKHVVATNEGDETVSVYDWMTGQHIKTVSTREHGKRPRGVKLAPDGNYIVTLEGSDNFLVLDGQFNVVKAVATKTGPYGIGFDPSGKYMLVAASRASTLQVFDAKTFAPVKDIEVGARCWHFTYTPDGSKILVACGRTNDIRVIDAKTYAPLPAIADGKMPWGVVTYPRSHGSLDTP